MRMTLLTLVFIASVAAHAVPTTMSYAGTLKDNGTPVNGTVDVVFSLFDAPTSGTQLYTETQTALVVVDGLLVADIGQNGLDDTVLDAPQLFLEVDVDGEPLLPRVHLESVPYALRADKAATAAVADALGTIAPADVVTHTTLVSLHLDQGINAGSGISISNGTISVSSITTTQIGDGQVTLAKLAGNSVDSSKIVDGSIVDADVSVTANIAGSKIATGSITFNQLASNSVIASKLANGAVSDIAISATANINGSKLQDGTVPISKLSTLGGELVHRPSNCGGGLDFGFSCTTTNGTVHCSLNCQTVTCRNSTGGAGFFDNCTSSSCTSTAPQTCNNTGLVGLGKTLPP